MPTKRFHAAFTVLVVEDDDLVRMNAVEMLEDAGLRVLEASDADEAWTILQDHDDIGALFTDIDMPGSMNGFSLAEKVAAHWPTIRLVLTSGKHRLAGREVPANGLFVPKPYRSAQVLDAIDHAG